MQAQSPCTLVQGMQPSRPSAPSLPAFLQQQGPQGSSCNTHISFRSSEDWDTRAGTAQCGHSQPAPDSRKGSAVCLI